MATTQSTETYRTSPGWYAAPNQPGYLRYWDGLSWTDDFLAQRRRRRIDPVDIVLSVLVPIVGFVWGLVLLGRGENDRGLAALITSVVAFVIFCALFGAFGGAR